MDSVRTTNSAGMRMLAVVWMWVALVVVVPACDGTPPEPKPPAVSQPAAHPPAAPAHQGTLVAVGDSLTAGLGVDETQAYPAQLARRLQSDGYAFRVVNAGVSGETSAGTLARIEWVIASLKPDIVILATGANDGLRGLDPERLHQNLERLIGVLQANDVQVILAGMRMLPNLGPEYIQAFEAVYPRIARDHGLSLVPFFLEGVAGVARYNQADGIHPTAQGYQRVIDNVYGEVVNAVQRHLAKRR